MSYEKLKTLIRAMVTEALEEVVTKTGQEIEFKVSPDNEASKKSAWVVDRIDAFVAGEPVGYLNISYIPSNRFKERYPTLFHYLIQRGMVHLDKYDFADPEQRKQAILAAFGINDWNRPSQEEMANPKFWKKMEKALNQKYGKEYEDFKNFHVDKPLVDYIRVREDQQRKGIGVALYDFGARYLAQKGLKLYASGVQSDQAKAAWEFLRRARGANIGTEMGPHNKMRTFLSYL